MTTPEPSRQFTCADCNAALLLPPAQSMDHCPFCGSPRFAPVPPATVPALSAFLPFDLPTARATAIYRRWLGTRLFRPHGVNHTAIGRLHPVYIPAWLCHATAISVWTIPDHESEPDEPTADQHIATYSHILISASCGLPEDWLIDLGGFAIGQARPANEAVMRDHPVEIAAVAPETALAVARRQIEATERAACAASLPDVPAASLQVQTAIDNATAALVGLPVWLASFSFHGAHYRCLINGQTGTVSGEAPVSGTKIAILVGIVILAIVAVLIVTQLYGS